jgi:hypothetical protein
MNYYSPELVRYIRGGENAGELTGASDIFALGLIFTEYLSGSLPSIDPHREPAVAVMNGAVLRVPARDVPRPVVDLVERMMSADPLRRPAIGDVHAALMEIGRAPTTVGKPPGRPAPVPTVPPSALPAEAATSSLRGRGLRLATGLRPPDPSAPPAAAPAASPVSRLVGTLLDRLARGGGR